jgi:hypothetical protein
VHVAAGLEVAAVDDEAAARALSRDLERNDAEVAGKRSDNALPDKLDRYVRVFRSLGDDAAEY